MLLHPVISAIALQGELGTLLLNRDHPDALAFMARAFASQTGTDERDARQVVGQAARAARELADDITEDTTTACRDLAIELAQQGARTCPALRQVAALNPQLSRRQFVAVALLMGLDPQTARIQWGKIDRSVFTA